MKFGTPHLPRGIIKSMQSNSQSTMVDNSYGYKSLWFSAVVSAQPPPPSPTISFPKRERYIFFHGFCIQDMQKKILKKDTGVKRPWQLLEKETSHFLEKKCPIFYSLKKKKFPIQAIVFHFVLYYYLISFWKFGSVFSLVIMFIFMTLHNTFNPLFLWSSE